MGFDVALVQSHESHYGEFVCKVCLGLVEEPVYTSCTHIFCRSCLDQWLANCNAKGQPPKCPACNENLVGREVQDLRSANALGWRLLGRIRCSCPLYESCSWQGDYSELGSHLLSNESHIARGSANEAKSGGLSKEQQAEALKAQGNSKYEQRQFRDAITFYSKAIALCPDVCSYYGNRAAAWFMVGAYAECISDCQAAVGLDPSYSKGRVRMARALCEQGNFDRAMECLIQGRHLESADTGELQVMQEEVAAMKELFAQGVSHCRSKEFEAAVAYLAKLQQMSDAPIVQCWLARALIGDGQCDRAVRILLGTIKADQSNAEAYKVRGLALCLSGDVDQSQKHIKEALRLDPDDGEALRWFRLVKALDKHLAIGTEAAKNRDFETAEESYAATIGCLGDLSGVHALKYSWAVDMLAECAKAKLRLKKFADCIEDCSTCISLREDCKSAYLTKTSALQAQGKVEEALEVMEALMRLEIHSQDSVVRHTYEKAQFEVRKAKRPNYYEILGVPRISSVMEIKQAYKQVAMRCHPDKVPEEERAAAEEKFKQLQEALDILATEPVMKRQLYDEGYDREAIVERVQRAEQAAQESDWQRRHRHH
mmetsp:Transcript_3684/g.13252  ORF Transcript_3684/g.13252 Transcript_3684/m.13252 type:complete len:599 (+) Transcript_3684:84-1880(+)